MVFCIRRARRALISDCERLVEEVCIGVVVVADLFLVLIVGVLYVVMLQYQVDRMKEWLHGCVSQ